MHILIDNLAAARYALAVALEGRRSADLRGGSWGIIPSWWRPAPAHADEPAAQGLMRRVLDHDCGEMANVSEADFAEAYAALTGEQFSDAYAAILTAMRRR